MTALKRLIGHSVASRLFDKELLQNHLSFCNKMIASTKVIDLEYEHSQQGLETLIELINEMMTSKCPRFPIPV